MLTSNARQSTELITTNNHFVTHLWNILQETVSEIQGLERTSQWHYSGIYVQFIITPLVGPLLHFGKKADTSKPVLLWKRIEWTTTLPGGLYFTSIGSRFFCEKLTVTQVVTKLSAFNGTQFSIVLTKALQQYPFSTQMNLFIALS